MLTTRELFARLLKCEAGGEGEDGMRAVATVCMNRVNVTTGEYARVCQGDLRKVIMQPYQFTCCLTTVGGNVNTQNIWACDPEQINYEVADWAIGGGIFSGAADCLWYFNPFNPSCTGKFPRNGTGIIFNRIGQHCFYIPTSLYAKT